jgi:ATP-dependent DNA ligase
MMQDTAYGLTEKVNGVRCVLEWDGRTLSARNRRGEPMAPPAVAERLTALGRAFLVDGEKLGEEYAAFDLLEWDGADLRGARYAERIGKLEAEFRRAGLVRWPGATLERNKDAAPGVYLLTPVRARREKEAVLRAVERRGGEGVILRLMDAPAVQGDSRYERKHKFVSDIDAFVTGTNMEQGRLSLRLGLRRPSDGAKVDIGSVRAGLTDQDVLDIKARIDRGEDVVMKVTFTRARTVGVRPVEPRTSVTEIRTDKSPEECTTDQLVEVFGPERAAAIESAV